MKFCSFCGQKNDGSAQFCGDCGKPFSTTKLDADLEYKKANLLLKKQKLELEAERENNMAHCPRCGSTSLVANKKGFGVGKAVIGASLLGSIGLAAGGINSKKVWVTCLNCGKRFKL